ncbi:MAG: endolytic transglycosylase MltG [Solirubrobacteraceae bacterium]|nr:endolytic transglycosylase MltG [Solirubrobacteraceae bacterium]
MSRRRGRGERSEEERRQARLEREQRRARREGRPIPERLDEATTPAADEPPAGAPVDHAPLTPPVDPAQAVHPHADGPPAARGHAGTPPGPTVEPQPAPADARPSHDVAAPPPAPRSVDWFGEQDAPATSAPAEPPTADPPPAHPPSADGTRPSVPATPPSREATPGEPRRPAGAPEPPVTGTEPRRRGRPSRDRAATARADAPRAAGSRADAPGRDVRTPRGGAGARDRDATGRSRPRPTGAAPRTGGGKPRRRGLFRRRREPEPVTTHSGRPALVPAHAPDLSPRTAPARRGLSRVFAVLVLIPIVLAVAGYVVLFEPFKGEGTGSVEVKIAPGTSVDDIGKVLEREGVVSSGLIFAIRARVGGAGSRLRAGTIRLRRDMSYSAALDALQQEPLPPAVVTVAFPEGLSRREAAAVARKAGITGDYLSATGSHEGFDPRRYGQPRDQKGLEGFLFPATYELPRGGATAKALVGDQLEKFRTEIRKVDMRRARRAKLNRYEVLIIASLIEREVSVPSERADVAAVIYNRLERRMPLGIDATIRYAERNWTRPLRQSELERPGPYNTRLRVGLPPTPIGSPGLAAIEAAAAPSSSKALYYVVRPCGNGRHNFSTSDAQFQRDAAHYRSEQRRVGGDPANATGCAKR